MSKMCVLCVKMLQSRLTLWVMDCSPPGSSFPWIFQAEYWVAMGSSPGDLPDPGIEPGSLKFPALAGEFFTTRATWEAHLPANLRDFSESSLLTFGPDLDLQFFPSVTRGGWFIRKQCFFLGEGKGNLFSIDVPPKRENDIVSSSSDNLCLIIPCWMCVVKDSG